MNVAYKENFCDKHYDSRTGRFLSEDPIHFNGGDPNLYRYAGNMPIMYRDPYGLYSWDEFLDDSSDYSAGFGDTITFGGTAYLRNELGNLLGHGSPDINKCSDAYSYGKYSAYAWEAAMILSGTASKAGYDVWFRRYPKAGGGGIGLDKAGKNLGRIDWHRFGDKNLPHIDIPGKVKHWPRGK